MKRYYNNGIECHLYEEGYQPEGYVWGRISFKGRLDNLDFNEVVEYFKSHTESETRAMFNINGHQLGKICSEVGFIKDQSLIVATRTRRNKERFGVDNVFQLNDVIDKCMNTRIEKFGSVKAAYKNRNNKIAETLQKRTGDPTITNVFQLEEVKDKIVDTMVNNNPGLSLDEIRSKIALKSSDTKEARYGYRGVLQTHEVESKKRKKYTYDNEQFDSSWELALWIYAKDHNEEIIRSPFEIEYTYNDQIHYYHPDFLYKGEIVEIKSDRNVDSEGNLIDLFGINQGLVEAKNQCMIDNHVKMMVYKDIKFAIDYVNETYGRTYLKSFKNH